MSMNRYAYRLRGGLPVGRVTQDYAAKAPATSALYDHIRYLAREQAWKEGNYSGGTLTNAEVKKIAAEDYQLITYVLIEQPELKDLQEDERFLRHLEAAGVDNWDGYGFAVEAMNAEDEEDAD